MDIKSEMQKHHDAWCKIEREYFERKAEEEKKMAIKKRCIRCLQVLREDGTCQNPKCVKYVPEGVNEIPEGAEVLEVYEEPQEQK